MAHGLQLLRSAALGTPQCPARQRFSVLFQFCFDEVHLRYAAASFAAPQSFIAPLHCLLLLAKVFQYKPEDQRGPVEPFCAAISPTLLQTLQQSLQQPFTPAIADIQLIVTKIFFSLTMFSLPHYFRVADTLGVWLQALLAISRELRALK